MVFDMRKVLGALWNRLNKKTFEVKSKDRLLSISGSLVKFGAYSYGYQWISILRWDDDNEVVLEIGRFSSISYGLKVFIGGNHRSDWGSTYPFGHFAPTADFIEPVQGYPQKGRPVKIGNDVCIWARCNHYERS